MIPEILQTELAERLHQLEGRVRAACNRAGRSREAVTVVAVTKTVSANVAALLHELGQIDMGESRPQVLWAKAVRLPQTVRWHQIGHLQRNKIERTVPLVARIHSVDSERLLAALIAQVEKHNLPPLSLCLEVNISREPNKHGFAREEIAALHSTLLQSPHLRIDGLMAMAAYSDNPEGSRAGFRELSELRERLETKWEMRLPELSMGMSNDFEVAIEEGATLIRPGSVLFEGLEDSSE